MATTAASVGNETPLGARTPAQQRVLESLLRLSGWLEANHYRGYDTFDGLSAKYVRPLTLESRFLRTVLQQGVRRFPINLRPWLGIPRAHSSKGMGFLARGFIRLHRATGQPEWARKAEYVLQWLIDHRSPGYSGACWGNHFDYQSRTFYLPKGTPTVVWTSLIGHAFLDAFEHFGDERYLEIASSACDHILHDLSTVVDGEAACISYIPRQDVQVHNANTLGASLLARTWLHTGTESFRHLASRGMRYTARYQHADGSWYYGENENLHWIDNFHTAYVLDCFQHYAVSTGDTAFEEQRMLGYRYWKSTFFLANGTPKYYQNRTLPIDIQCSSQAIDTLVFFSGQDSEALALASRVALWTIANMQDDSGYFYYRRYSPRIVNKTPTLHWGQATMMCALGGLYERLSAGLAI